MGEFPAPLSLMAGVSAGSPTNDVKRFTRARGRWRMFLPMSEPQCPLVRQAAWRGCRRSIVWSSRPAVLIVEHEGKMLRILPDGADAEGQRQAGDAIDLEHAAGPDRQYWAIRTDAATGRRSSVMRVRPICRRPRTLSRQGRSTTEHMAIVGGLRSVESDDADRADHRVTKLVDLSPFQ